jgi:hypothetical protein
MFPQHWQLENSMDGMSHTMCKFPLQELLPLEINVLALAWGISDCGTNNPLWENMKLIVKTHLSERNISQ